MIADDRQLAQARGTSAPTGRREITVGHVTRDDRRRTMKTSERVSLDIVRDIVAQGLRSGDGLPLEPAMARQHFQAQHDYYAEHWPARLSELIEWR